MEGDGGLRCPMPCRLAHGEEGERRGGGEEERFWVSSCSFLRSFRVTRVW